MAKTNLVIDQGTTYSANLVLKDQSNNDLDVTGYQARGQIRKHYQSNTSVSLTTALSNGVVTISLTAAQTANITSGRYVYDVELIDGSNTVTRPYEGIVTITPEVTR